MFLDLGLGKEEEEESHTRRGICDSQIPHRRFAYAVLGYEDPARVEAAVHGVAWVGEGGLGDGVVSWAMDDRASARREGKGKERSTNAPVNWNMTMSPSLPLTLGGMNWNMPPSVVASPPTFTVIWEGVSTCTSRRIEVLPCSEHMPQWPRVGRLSLSA